GRARFAALSLNHIKELPHGIFQDILLNELSKRARVPLESLNQQVKMSGETKPELLVPTDSSFTKLRLAPPLRLAMALLIQQPKLAELIQEPLSEENHLAGQLFFIQLIEIIKNNINWTTGALLEYWRGQKEEAFIGKLAQFEHMVPEESFEKAFLGAIRQIMALNHDEAVNRLLAKAAGNGLSDEEKQQLSLLIAKKKALITQ
ncbi:MAG: DNA primase, partial [uncultured bacterium]